MATIRLPRDFKEFLKSFHANQVEYLMVGGYAVGFYGYPRTTGDLDLWVAMSESNAERIVAAVSDFGFRVPNLSASLFQKPDQVVRMGVPPLRIDLLTTIEGVSFEDCFASRTIATIDGVITNLISIDHLRINKKACGRHKDLDDLDHLP